MRKFSITNDTGISKQYQASTNIHENDSSRDDINIDIVGYSSQAFPKKIARKRKTLSVFKAPVCGDLDAALAQLKPRHLKTLNSILGYSNRYQVACPSQTTMGNRIGLSRGRVNESVGELESLGLISTKYRHLTTSEYLPARNFLDPKVRSKYAPIFRALFVMPWTFLLANSGMPPNLDVTQYKYKSSSKVNISLENDIIHRLSSNHLSDEVIFALANGKHIREIYYPVFNRQSMNVHESIQQVICGSKGKTVQESPIRESIRDLKSLNLSRWGQIELMKFPDEAIYHASRTLTMVKPRDPFIYFLKICNDYCKSNNLRPDYSLTQALIEKYKRPEKYTYTITPLSGAQFAKSIVNGFSAYSARRPESETQGGTPQRNKLVSIDAQRFTMDEIRSRKEARQRKANEKLVSNGQQAITFVEPKDPFTMSDDDRKKYFSSMDPLFLRPALKLGLGSPLIESSKKLMIIKTMNDSHISFEGIITPPQIEKLISHVSQDSTVPDTLASVDGRDQNAI